MIPFHTKDTPMAAMNAPTSWEPMYPGTFDQGNPRRQGQRDRGVQMRAGHRAARIDGQGDREPPEKSRCQQTGLEAIAACPRDGEGDEAVAEENQNECSQHFGQVFLSPAFGYCHYFLLLAFDQMSRDDACTMVSPLLHLLWRATPRKKS